MGAREVDSGFVIEHQRRVLRARVRFDGVAYAMRMLRALAPRTVTVAVRRSERGLLVEQGRAWDKGPEQRWATLAIPPWASREEIATAVLTLLEREGEPYLFDAMLRLEEPD